MSIVTTQEKTANTIAFSHIYVIKQFTCIIYTHIFSVLLLPNLINNFNLGKHCIFGLWLGPMLLLYIKSNFKLTFPATDLAACCLMCAKFDWLYAKFANTIRSS